MVPRDVAATAVGTEEGLMFFLIIPSAVASAATSRRDREEISFSLAASLKLSNLVLTPLNEALPYSWLMCTAFSSPSPAVVELLEVGVHIVRRERDPNVHLVWQCLCSARDHGMELLVRSRIHTGTGGALRHRVLALPGAPDSSSR